MKMQKRYRLKGASVEDITVVLDKFWGQLSRTDSAVCKRAQEKGIDLTELRNMKRAEAIVLKWESSGLDPATVAILITLGAKIVGDLWDKVLLPMIRQDKGDTVLTPGPEEMPSEKFDKEENSTDSSD